MKYIAIFDIPDDYGIGCAIAKVIQKDKYPRCDSDFENAYAQVEPLSNVNAEVLERFNAVDRVLADLGLRNAYDMPGFWYNNGKNYKVIDTKWHKGYRKALADVEKEIRSQFGFAERDNVLGGYYPAGDLRADGERKEGR
jgi:hypothetical protein